MAKNHRQKVKGNRKGKIRSGRRNTYSKYKHKLKPTPKQNPFVFDFNDDWTSPLQEGGVEACKVRVANGMKCYCLEKCGCRSCRRVASCSSYTGDTDDCITACKTCSNHKPCV